MGYFCLEEDQTLEDEMLVSDDMEKRNVGVRYPDYTLANQLQFVNRELHTVTKGLGLRYNLIIIRNHRELDKSVLRRFLKFIELSTIEHRNLTTIILKDRGAREREWVPNLESACKFCKRNPHIFIKLHQDKTRPDEVGLVLYVTFIKHVYWRDPSFYARITEDSMLQQELQTGNQTALAIVPALPQSLRMFPAEKSFDETAFRYACCEDLDEGWIIGTIGGGIDTWILLIREWYKNGF
ncbi:hypothetical protein P153DRAFT_402534 [Dothidotthia symphoricarpi CBS 119687]|uniref:Uncharacterized protein n=1 Tax=Dothidotthia symphoricarpi CBS 119687 TaxID=1392245 RepID=A0A6A6ASV9_9PLEO|nr:uncharacterized protein P153DRAFT_402534 [Dothidotthia symphoricarpi CBS 119687]KAF2134740.1 hypothetical protein P153DRAFT_402534 [Dothidotthia symphoricarpi CBS 119687]